MVILDNKIRCVITNRSVETAPFFNWCTKKETCKKCIFLNFNTDVRSGVIHGGVVLFLKDEKGCD